MAEPSQGGRAEGRADARNVRGTGLVRGPADDVGDLDVPGACSSVADLVGDVLGGESDEVLVHAGSLFGVRLEADE